MFKLLHHQDIFQVFAFNADNMQEGKKWRRHKYNILTTYYIMRPKNNLMRPKNIADFITLQNRDHLTTLKWGDPEIGRYFKYIF